MLRSISGGSPNAVISIDFPEAPALRARNVVSRSRARPTGKYPSWKMGRMVQWESHNELNAYRLLDANPAVRAFHEQPLVIHYQLGGESHIHYPDTLVDLGTSRELWEVKPATEAARPENVARTEFLTSALLNHGFTYRMVLAEELKRQPRLSNIQTMLKFGRQPISLVEREQIRQILANSRGIHWGALTKRDLGGRGRFILARLVLEGRLLFDMDACLDENTLFIPIEHAQRG